MILNIAGIIIKISTSDDRIKNGIVKRYSGYIIESSDYKYTLTVEEKKGAGFTPEKGEWRTESEESGSIITVSSIGTEGFFDLETEEGKAFIRKGFEINTFDNFMRVLISYLLAKDNGFLLHAAGISDGKNGYVFPGHSGAGKSTLSKYAPENFEIFSDDIVIVKKGKSFWEMHTSPFHGEETLFLREIKNVPVKRVLIINKDTNNRIEKIDPVRSVAFILSCVPFIAPETKLYDNVWNSIIKLVEEVEINKLFFKKGGEVWEIISEKKDIC